jgi:ABC-type transport system involved in multi-copper enzyme maturation permease subunit
MLGIPAYLYRLVPANPILLRVVSVGGKRKKDLFVRCGYLGLLIFVVILTLIGGDVGGGDLDRLTTTSTTLFVYMSYLQLALVALLAPIFTAGAITQEKDSQTYDILLATPLTNGQIVLGTLLSRLFFVFALLVSGIPVFGITQIFGGVAFGDILLSAAIAGTTALITGALATTIATFKVGTRRTIFSFYMLIVVYLLGLFLLDVGFDGLSPAVLDPDTGQFSAVAQTSWLSGVHPFLALRTILDPVGYAPPAMSDLPPGLRDGLVGWYLTAPAAFFVTAGVTVSLLLVLPSVVLLRRMAQSTASPKAWVLDKLAFLPGVTAPGNRPPRTVWHNPIAWREARTKASASRAGLLRYGFIAAGLIGAIIVCWLYAQESGEPRRYIERGAFDARSQTILLRGEDGGTFSVLPSTTFQFEGESVSATMADRRLAVVGEPGFTITATGARAVTSVSLAEIPRRLDRETARRLLLGMVFIEVAVILLIVTNAAASTVTREREDGTLDLLLSTPITSRYYIWGKLRGLVSFALPLILVPTLSCLVFVLYDTGAVIGRGGSFGEWLVLPEAIVLVPLLLVVLVSFASIVGMNLSLRTKTTVRSVMASLGIVIGLFALLGWCGSVVTQGNNGFLGLVFAAFSPLTVIMILIDPRQFGGEAVFYASAQQQLQARVIIFAFALIAAGSYLAGVWAMYKNMVTNFDMTIRRQQR